MKKTLLIMIALSFLLFCACGKESGGLPGYRSKDVGFTADLTYGDEKYTFDCERSGDRLTLTFVSPERLKGVKLISDKDGNKLSYSSLELIQKKENPLLSAVGSVFGLTDEMRKKAEKQQISGSEVDVLTFGTENGDVILYIPSGSSFPARIEGTADGVKYTADFSSAEFFDN